MIKPGDFVMMQFGHNDGGPLDDAARARGTLHGVGDETREIDNPIARQNETVHTYGWYLKQFIADARAKGATPIMCTLIPRKIWKDGKIVAQRRYLCRMGAAGCSERTHAADRSERTHRAALRRAWSRRRLSRCSATRTPTPAAPARS